MALILILITVCPTLFAGTGPDPKHTEEIKKKVGHYVEREARVSLETYDARKLQGSISEAGPETFVLSNEGRSTTLSYADVKKIKAPMSRRTKQAIVTAIVLGGLFGLVGGALSTDK
jgi:hypothetical protein